MSIDSDQENKNPVFGDPEVNKIKRQRNKLQKENEEFRKQINSSKMKLFERKESAKALLIVVASLTVLVYLVWFR